MSSSAVDHVLKTPRLTGRPLDESDFADLRLLHRDPRVLETFGGEPATEDDTREFLERKLAHWHEHGFGIWMFRDSTGAFMGRCGIHRMLVAGQDEVELGYIVRSQLWSQGFATEMGDAVVEHAFSTFAIPELVGFTSPDNAASRRVLEKLGFAYERDFEHHGEPTVLYRRFAG